MAAVGCLASQPGLLEETFITKKVNDAGIYAFRFYLNGREKIVVVDDYLPCLQKHDEPFFSHSKVRGEFWMCLLEKAWAKLHGSFG
jgi:hypothetical protein